MVWWLYIEVRENSHKEYVYEQGIHKADRKYRDRGRETDW